MDANRTSTSRSKQMNFVRENNNADNETHNSDTIGSMTFNYNQQSGALFDTKQQLSSQAGPRAQQEVYLHMPESYSCDFEGLVCDQSSTAPTSNPGYSSPRAYAPDAVYLPNLTDHVQQSNIHHCVNVECGSIQGFAGVNANQCFQNQTISPNTATTSQLNKTDPWCFQNATTHTSVRNDSHEEMPGPSQPMCLSENQTGQPFIFGDPLSQMNYANFSFRKFSEAHVSHGNAVPEQSDNVHTLQQPQFTSTSQYQTTGTTCSSAYTSALPGTSKDTGHVSLNKDQDPEGYNLLIDQKKTSKSRPCMICGETARGKNYGVFTCDSCKGFFSRTIKKNLKYHCRENRKCQIDQKLRTRCQYCRFAKCIQLGMKREDLAEGKSKTKQQSPSNITANFSDLTLEKLLEAGMVLNETVHFVEDKRSQAYQGNIMKGADNQLKKLVKWTKQLPYFNDFDLEDQITLLRHAWTEILILGFSYRSMAVRDGILLSTGVFVHKTTAQKAGSGPLLERILTELVDCMRRLSMDLTEMACLRSIILVNPQALGIVNAERVEQIHDGIHDILEEYCLKTYPDQPGRYSKLILRLPALRGIKLKCMETMFFMKSCGAPTTSSVMMAMMDNLDKDEVE